jgi:hypothetical protein
MLLGGGSKLYKYSANGAFSPLGNPPLGISVTESIAVVDPASGRYLVHGDGTKFYEYEISTDTWTARSAASVPPIWKSGDVFDTIAAPIGTYGVVMYIKYDFNNSKIYVYKHNPG